jgi:inosine-uridine nucleoside N-ribohydrolase
MTQHLWMDTDPGFDDLVAMVLAAAWPELQMEGVGVAAGNAPLERVLVNNL